MPTPRTQAEWDALAERILSQTPEQRRASRKRAGNLRVATARDLGLKARDFDKRGAPR